MEQWTVDGRQLLEARFAKAVAAAQEDLRTKGTTAHASSPSSPGGLSKLLNHAAPSSALCRPVAHSTADADAAVSSGSNDDRRSGAPMLVDKYEFRFVCAKETTTHFTAVDTVWSTAQDLTGGYAGILKAHHVPPATISLHPRADRPNHEGVAGARPAPYAEVKVLVAMYADDGRLNDVAELEFVAGAGTVPQCLEEGVLAMTTGERALFLADPAFGYRDSGSPAGRTSLATVAPPPSGDLSEFAARAVAIQPDAVVAMDVTLLGYSNPPTTPDEAIDRAEALKKQANALVGEKRFAEAARLFQKAMEGLLQMPGPPPNRKLDEVYRAFMKQRADALRSVLFHNQAVCAMELRRFDEGIRFCQRAIALDPRYVKAYYRKVMILVEAERLDDAEKELERIATLGASGLLLDDTLTQSLKAKIAQKKSEMRQAATSAWTGRDMFA